MSDTPVDMSYIQNLQELRDLGVPDSISMDAVRALEAFWGQFNNEFPEVTHGDTQMVDEPINAMVQWLCQYAGIPVDQDDLVVQDICLHHGMEEARFDTALKNGIEAVRMAMSGAYRNLGQPSYEVHQQLRAIMSTHLNTNYPRPPEVEYE